MNAMILIDHRRKEYRRLRNLSFGARYNGAYYYSKEIVSNIIPKVKTDRNWITVNVRDLGCDHAIVFVHNNMHPENYEWLKKYDDLILVCGIPSTVQKVEHIARAIYLPLSIDVQDVLQYETNKTKNVAYAGRAAKRKDTPLWGIDHLEGMPRDQLLRRMAEYKQIYAVGRTAIEAACLGCEILPYDPRYPDPSIWKVIDNSEAAEILQQKINEIDG